MFPILILLIAPLLAVGIGLYHFLYHEPSLWATFGMLPTAMIFLFSLVYLKRNKWSGLYKIIGILNFCFLGFILAHLQTILTNTELLNYPLNNVNIEGDIRHIEITSKGYQKVIIENIKILTPHHPTHLKTAQITIRSKKEILQYADHIRVRVDLFPPGLPAFPGGYNFRKNFWFEGIGAIGFARGHAEILSQNTSFLHNHLTVLLNQTRQSLSQKIITILPGDEASVAKALILGDQGSIPQKIIDDMQNSGLSHLLSVSGLHLSLVGVLTFGLFRRVLILYPLSQFDWPRKKIAALLTILIAFFYLLLTYAAVPTQRSFMMVALVMIGILLDRQIIGLYTLAWAAIIILIFNPYSLLTASFQMSFVAVAVIIAIVKKDEISQKTSEQSNLRKTNSLFLRFGRYISQLIKVSFWISLAIMPITLYHFNQASIYGILANLLAIPITSFWVMPAALMGVLLSLCNLENIPFIIMGEGISWILNIANFITQMPYATVNVSFISLAAALIFTLIIFLILAPSFPYKTSMIVILLGIAFFTTRKPNIPDIIVSIDEKMIVLKNNANGYLIITSQKSSFLLKIWQESLRKTRIIPWAYFYKHPDFVCDTTGCSYKIQDKTILILWQNNPQDYSCETADLVINLNDRGPISCNTVPVIQKSPGQPMYWGWITPKKIEILSTTDLLGNRPWIKDYSK